MLRRIVFMTRALSDMFGDFEAAHIDTCEARIFIRRKGAGAPVLLLHGFPQTHLMWRDVAPAMAEVFTVVCADLRGYGASSKPPSDAAHAAYAKRAMAADMVRLMAQLGFGRFAVAGHDRGGRVAYRMALDHPERVGRLAVLDVVPTVDVFERVSAEVMLGYWPWSLLAQPAPLPERLMQADPEAFLDAAIEHWGSDSASFPPDVRAAYIAALADPESVRAICEEYRAAASVDVEHDRADREAGRRIACSTLVLWAKDGAVDRSYEDAGGPLGIWRSWVNAEVYGQSLEGGHFFAEQNPAAVAEKLRAAFAG